MTQANVDAGESNAVKINRPTDIVRPKVRLVGTADLMFDRYPGENSTTLEPWQKFYFLPGDSKAIGIPALNVMSFLSAHNSNSAPKRLRDKRKYKDIANAALSFVQISQTFIPLLRNGKPVVFGKFEHDLDPLSGCYVHRSVARLDKGIPNAKERPTLPTPWEIEFDFMMLPNREIKEQEILNLF